MSWRAGLLVAVVGLLLASACAPVEKPPVQPAVKPQPPSVLRDADWGRFRSQRHNLSLPFPDGATWRIDDHSSPWLEATHPGTGTRLRVRSWIERNPVSRASCEKEARRFAPEIPQPDEAGTIDERVTDLFAPDFDARIVVGIGEADPRQEGITGYVIAFGASARTCVAFWFESRVQGPKGSMVLAERLEVGTRMAENSIYVSRLPAGPLEAIPTPTPRQ